VPTQKPPYSFFGPNRFDLTPFKALNTCDSQFPNLPPKKSSADPFPFHKKGQLSAAAPVFCPADQEVVVTAAPSITTTANTVEKVVESTVQAPNLEPVVAVESTVQAPNPKPIVAVAITPRYVAIKPDPGTPIKAEICEFSFPAILYIC
jgi:hypothetical protein